MTTDLLEKRLQQLATEVPDATRVTARVMSNAAKPRPRRAPRVIVATIATVGLTVLVLYYAPAADTALASVPVAGELLRDAGLVAAAGRITSVGSVSTSSGYKVKLVGAYADSSRTVLLVHSDPPSLPGFAGQTVLTDQFGRSYNYQGGTADMRTGDETMQFDALAWPDGITGARITLHMSAVTPVYTTGPGQQVAGSWTLPATIGVDEGTALPLPADGTLGAARFHFISATYTPATIVVDIDVSGVSYEELSRNIPDGRGKATPALTIDVIDPNGEIINGYSSSNNDFFGGNHIHVTGFRLGGGGKYLLRVSYIGAGEFERTLLIP